MLSAPAESPYDLRFDLFGFSIRIAWTFWVAAFVLGYESSIWISRIFPDGPGRLVILAIWVGTMFVSILIHELGHAFAFRQCGMNASVVLYHFGGLAIPSDRAPSRGGIEFAPLPSMRRISPWQDIFISLAGPLVQMASALLLIVSMKVLGYKLEEFLPFGMEVFPGMTEGNEVARGDLYAFTLFYLFISLYWAVINLLPIWPLDGGHVARSLGQLYGFTMEQTLWLSVIAAAMTAVYGLQRGDLLIGVMFASFAFQSYQMIQHRGGRF